MPVPQAILAPLGQLQAQLHSSEQGLASLEAERRLAEVGPNEPAPRTTRHLLAPLLVFLRNPLMAVLLVAAAASALLGQAVDAAIIAAIVLLGGAIDFVQGYRSQRAVARLQASLAPTATALRDGAWGEVPRARVVPGDVVRLEAGDLVPADARLLAAKDLHVNEAALTGESLPVEKEAAPGELGLVRFGTSVVSGTGTALVFATGSDTAFGAVAASLAAKPPETEFERGARRFGHLIMSTVVMLVLFVVLASVMLGRQPLESLLFAVALAVGLTPEFLPMISTVTLARGAVHMARRRVIVKNLAAIQNFGSIDILCSDKTGTLTSGKMALERAVDPQGAPGGRALALAYLNSAHETGVRSPLDAAILAQPAPPEQAGARKLDEVPFDFERRRVSVVVEAGGERLLVAKGAPEGVLPLCVGYEPVGQPARPLDAEARAACEAAHCRLSEQGHRVLAVAYRRVEPQAAYGKADEHDLVLAGFLAFADPPLEHTAEALAALARDGVRVKILTGDGDLVARHVCGRVGLELERVVTGEELNRVSDAALGRVAEATTLFARVTPAQKNRVLQALRSRGHVVGFLGDGINDAPSLHAADVGISVAGAVDVARDAAEVILLERDLAVLHQGILEGRRAFGNVIKYLLMGTSSNFGNMFSMAGAFLFLPFLPMLPTQVLLNNFLYDLAQVTIPTDRVEERFVRKPRRWDVSLIRNFMLALGPLSSLYDFLTFYVLLRVFHASETEFHTGWFVESLATQTLVIFVIRTAGNPLRDRPSMPLLITTLAVVVVGALLPLLPFAHYLGFVPLPATFYLFVLGATATYLVLVAVVRRLVLRQSLG